MRNSELLALADQPRIHWESDANYRPRVTIICSTFNHENYIEKAINSFLAQEVDFQIQIIIKDDASTDRTAEIILEYQAKYPELIYPLLFRENLFSKGVRISATHMLPIIKGEYVAYCEGDDYWTDTSKLQKQVNFLDKNAEYTGGFTNYSIVDEKGKILNEKALDEAKNKIEHVDILKRITPKTLCCIFRKNCIPLELPKEYYKVNNGDLFLHSMLSRKGPYFYMDDVTGAYREHSFGIWSLIGQEKRYLSQINTSLTMMNFFKNEEEIDALRHRLKVACNGLIKIHEDNGNIFKAWWYKIIIYRSIFKYSPNQIWRKLF